MKKTEFWVGVIILVVGVFIFACGSFPLTPPRQVWNLANIFRLIGLGMSALGTLVLAYGILRKVVT